MRITIDIDETTGAITVTPEVDKETCRQWIVGDDIWTYDEETETLTSSDGWREENVRRTDPVDIVRYAHVLLGSGHVQHRWTVQHGDTGYLQMTCEAEAIQMCKGLRTALGKTGLGEAWDLWELEWGTIRWDAKDKTIVICDDSAPTITKSDPIEGEMQYGIGAIKQIGEIDQDTVNECRYGVTIETTGAQFWISFDSLEEAQAFTQWLDEQIKAGLNA